jgi:SAM-dependent methyltransferase
MKLSELVHLYNQISEFETATHQREFAQHAESLFHILNSHKVQMSFLDKALKQKNLEIRQKFQEFDHELDSVKQKIRELIDSGSKPWFIKSYQDYEEATKTYQGLANYRPPREGKGYWTQTADNMKMFLEQNNQQILSRQLGLPEQTQMFFESRVIRTANWQHPALIIHPGNENFVEHMVANDPLYLADVSHGLLEPALSKFNEHYRSRLRVVVYDENIDQPMLDKVPDAQIGVCLAYNFFNYRPFEVVKKYLEEIYQKLKPGGMLFMTFNDCDNYRAVELVENGLAAFTPGGLIISVADLIGYEIEVKHNDDSASTWLELKKPGIMTSLRGGQALAKIIPKSIAESK